MDALTLIITAIEGIAGMALGIGLGVFLMLRNDKKHKQDDEYLRLDYEHVGKQIDKIQIDENIEMIKYTNEMMKFIRDLVMDISSIEFDKYCNTIYTPSKITKEALKDVIRDCAVKANESLYSLNIDYEQMLVNKKFIESYIIDCTELSIRVKFKAALADEDYAAAE